jgi:hypothetical protein
MSVSKRNFVIGISLILICIMLLGCLPNKQGGFTCIATPLISKIKSMVPATKKTSPVASTGPTRPRQPARTGAITTGTKVQAASQSVDPSGGMVAVNKPGDPLDGFVIDVPAKSYSGSRKFKVSSAPITKQTFGNDINPISPMITVDNGGGYSDEIMFVRVPVKVPDGKFAMGFLYDEKSKQLEGMPMVGRDSDSITVATRHFSNFFISMIEEALLKKNIDSGFRPGIDDWQFDNMGSYIIPDGQCSGQSISVMWYYYAQPDGRDACLYGRYDNNGNQPATPDLWQDDSLGYRFCSTIQRDSMMSSGSGALTNWISLAGIGWKKQPAVEGSGLLPKWNRVQIPGISDESTLRLFAYSIQASGQPQFVALLSNAGTGHAMVCYAVSDNGTLLIADPNYHGKDDRMIEYADSKFKPYNSGANKADIDAGKGKAYEKIIYAGAWTLVSYDKVAGRWTEFKNRTIGNDRFPAYNLRYRDADGQMQDMKDGVVSPDGYIYVKATEALLSLSGPRPLMGMAFRDGTQVVEEPKGFKLNLGKNKLGIFVLGEVGNGWEPVDFKYFDVIYGSLSIDPATLSGEPNKQYTFTAKADSPPAGARFDWYVDGSKAQGNTSNSYTASFKTEGSHKVSVNLVDSAGKEIQAAEAAVTIKAAASGGSGGLAELQKTTLFSAQMLCDKFLFDEVTQSGNSPIEWSYNFKIPENAGFMSITWKGASFSGKTVTQPQNSGTHLVEGTVSPDGKTLLSVDYTYSFKDDSYVYTRSLKWKNIPIGPWITSNPAEYIVKMEARNTASIGGRLVRDQILLSPPIKDFKEFKLQCMFR